MSTFKRPLSAYELCERSCSRPRDLDMAKAIREHRRVSRSSYYNLGKPVTPAHQQQRTIERSAPGPRQMPAALRTPEYRELKLAYMPESARQIPIFTPHSAVTRH